MSSRASFLRCILDRLLKRDPKRLPHAVAVPLVAKQSTAARERVRSGIEPLEGRIAPAILVNAHLLTYTDENGDLVSVKFSKDIFDLSSVTLATDLTNVFKFTAGSAHVGSANATDDVPQQLQLIDLGQVPLKNVPGMPLKSRVAGVSITISAQTQASVPVAMGDGFANVGAIKAGGNALGVVKVDGDLGQIDSGAGTNKIGLQKLVTQSIGAFGTTTQVPVPIPDAMHPAPDLESRINGVLGALVVAEDVRGYIHVVDSVRIINNVTTITKRGTIGSVDIGGSLMGNVIGGSESDNTGRIESSHKIGDVRIGSTAADGILAGGGKNSGAITAAHSIGNVVVTGSIQGGIAEGSGAILSGGTLGTVTISGDLTGAAGLRSGSIRSAGKMGAVRIGTPGESGDVTGGSGDSSGLILSGGKLNAVEIFGSIVGNGPHSGGVFASGDLARVTVHGSVTGGANLASGAIEGLKGVGPVAIGGGVIGGDGAASGSIISGAALARVTIAGNLDGGKGANSGAILAGHNPNAAHPDLGDVTVGGALLGDEGVSSGTIVSGGHIGAVQIGASLSTGPSMQGGVGALSGSVFGGGKIESLLMFRGIEGGVGAGSASIQSHGLLGSVEIRGDLMGGTGVESASILSHENAFKAHPIAGKIGSVVVMGKLGGAAARTGYVQADGQLVSAHVGSIEGGTGSYSGAIVSGAGFVQAGATSSVVVDGVVEGGNGDHSGYIEIGGRLGHFMAGSLNFASIRVGDDLGTFTVNGELVNSFITARGQAAPVSNRDLAIGSIDIGGQVSNTRILAGYDVLGLPVNADAQIGNVRVAGDWTASVLAAGVAAGTDGLFGTADDRLIESAGGGSTIAKIASIIITGAVEGTADSDDHFGFVAERIGSFSSAAGALPLTAAGDEAFPLGTHGDVWVREVSVV
jgi:hypothetical protein